MPPKETSVSKKIQKSVQGTLFEQDYLLRSLGSIAHSADVALRELVANAWDAGASEVRISIPDDDELPLIVEDDGCGMTPEQFKTRWMTLGYDRVKHQGRRAEFPPERQDWRRMSFGQNGMGRHGLLCFADGYQVETSWNRTSAGSWSLHRVGKNHSSWKASRRSKRVDMAHSFAPRWDGTCRQRTEYGRCFQPAFSTTRNSLCT